MLRKFVAELGRDEVAVWYTGLSDRMQAHVETRIRYLAGLTQGWTIWDKKAGFKYIATGKGKGLGEIKIKVDGVHHRLIGFRGPESGDFTVVLVTDKKSPKLPDNTWKKAQKRRKRVEENKDLANEWNV